MTSPIRFPVMRPQLAPLEAVIGYLERMHASGRFATGGPLARELEARHAARLGVDPAQVVAVTSATLGLAGALAVSPQSHWSVPAFTFAATGHAVLNSGGTMQIHDVDPLTWQMPDQGNSAVVDVVPFGAGIDRTTWASRAEFVVDAAASLGAAELSLAHLPPGGAVVFSLQATKVMPCGEGGLVVCGDAARADEVRRWAHFRLDQARAAIGPGTNALMPEPSAAYALAALDLWQQEREEWRVAGRHADAVTARLGLGSAPAVGADAHPYWVVRLPTAEVTDAVEFALGAAGIASRRWWGPGLHRMPAFRPAALGDYPVTDELAATTLGLPFWRGLTEAVAGEIGSVIASVLDGEVIPASAHLPSAAVLT